jgi:hypothetical protein
MPGNLRSLATSTAAVVLLLSGPLMPAAGSERDAGARTVIGPENPDIAEGAEALLSGDTERGIQKEIVRFAVNIERWDTDRRSEERLPPLALP